MDRMDPGRFDDMSKLCKWLWRNTDEENTVSFHVDGHAVNVFMDDAGKLWESYATGGYGILGNAGPDMLLGMVDEFRETPGEDGFPTVWDKIAFDVAASAASRSQFKERGDVSCPGLPGVPMYVARKFHFAYDVVVDYLNDVKCAGTGFEEEIGDIEKVSAVACGQMPRCESCNPEDAAEMIFGHKPLLLKSLNERQLNILRCRESVGSDELVRIGLLVADDASGRADVKGIFKGLSDMVLEEVGEKDGPRM